MGEPLTASFQPFFLAMKNLLQNERLIAFCYTSYKQNYRLTGLTSPHGLRTATTVPPGPLTDAHWDSWIWHSFFDVRALTTTLADGVNAQAASVRLPVDSKAMRKWDPAETLVGMFEVVESGTAIITVSGDTRILLKAA